MLTFSELYKRKMREALTEGDEDRTGEEQPPEYDPAHLDCLLFPEKHAVIWKLDKCSSKEYCKNNCMKSCVFNALIPDGEGSFTIDPEKCNGCGACVEKCRHKNIIAGKDALPALNALKTAKGPVYALIAPSFTGQFSADVTPGKLRNAFKKLGFQGMIEVALFADILTLKESLEFDKRIRAEDDFLITSCCCPVWIAMIRKNHMNLIKHMPGSVSPMIAAGRVIKLMYPDAVTIFIGPCVAKKAEAREPDIAGAVDYVLTYQEVKEIFEIAGIDPAKEEENEKENSSRAGRIYGYAGGVSEAVESTLKKTNPDRQIKIRTRQADGIPACRAMINEIESGTPSDGSVNFYEGMGCNGGCCGGPKVIINKDEARKNIERYGCAAVYETPADNPFVLELLKRLGFNTIEDLIIKSEIFTRDFNNN